MYGPTLKSASRLPPELEQEDGLLASRDGRKRLCFICLALQRQISMVS